MNKYTNVQGTNQLQLNEIGLYNLEVKRFLQKNKLSPIVQHTVKLFKDSAQRRKLNHKQYNLEVEEFNNNHGYYILKKGTERLTNSYYSYINYPYLDREAVKNTMANYRAYVVKYNLKVQKENTLINEYNNTIVRYVNDLTKKEKSLKETFIKNSKNLNTWEYNKLVEKENFINPIHAKKRIQRVKYHHEITFHVLVGFYVSQLKARNLFLMQMNKPTSVKKSSLPKLKIDHRKLSTHTIDNLIRLDYSKRTAQEHVKRLLEAGILCNYQYINQNRPIQVNFNLDVLEVLDGNLPEKQNTVNQLVKSSNQQFQPDNNDTTRTLIKRKEIEDCVKNTVLKKCGSIQETDSEIYKNTRLIGTQFQKAGGTPKKINTLTNNFLNRLEHPQELAEALAAGNYKHYKGLRYDYFEKIIQYGQVSFQEFKEIVIQDFIKQSAKIWGANHNVYVGEWRKAINLLQHNLFKNITRKENIIKKLREYRWKLNFARKWFIKNNHNALYPSWYFDPTRTKQEEIGFYGLHKIWTKHLEYLKQTSNNRKNRIKKSNARKRVISNSKKMRNALNKFFNEKCSVIELYDYVNNNLPQNYSTQLATLINQHHSN
ncbi:conserved hypothetical protein [Tenacibaculum sp. 190524A02b]|uniref:Uncharacterized protein n=1 Tax=Tenacibaculum vairaonense TaxID=3137860 RepID=A0ABM9PS44_9FLAO